MVVTWQEIIAITDEAHARNLVIGLVDTAITDASRGGEAPCTYVHQLVRGKSLVTLA